MKRLLMLLLPVSVLLAGCRGQTIGATNVTSTSAILNGKGTCDKSCNVQFRYRVDNGRWTYTTPIHVSSTNGQVYPFSQNVGDLSPGTSYSYQICGDDQGENSVVCGGPSGSSSEATPFTTASSNAPRIKLMTYNVEYFKEFQASGHGNDPAPPSAIQAIKNDIAAKGATVVALEEVRQFKGDPNSEAQKVANALSWTGAGHVVYQGWTGDPNGCPTSSSCLDKGVAIISRYPITNPGSTDLLWTHGLHRKLIWGDVQIGGGKAVRVYATHLAAVSTSDPVTEKSDEAYTSSQLKDAVAKIAASGVKQAVFMGDFNLAYQPYIVNNLKAFDPLTTDRWHDWKVDRIPADLSQLPPKDHGTPIGDVCASKNPSGTPYNSCTYSNFDSPHHNVAAPYDKRDYIWVKGYPTAAGFVQSNCPFSCNSDHRPYWTDITP